MKVKLKQHYMRVAESYASLSHATVLQVGCVLVKDNRIISDGVNGTPKGFDNTCEEPLYVSEEQLDAVPQGREIFNDSGRYYYLKTRSIVLHSESNCIAKLTKSTDTGIGATLFTTHSPCMECSKLIYQAGIAKVVYKHQYRDDSGLKFLDTAGIIVEQLI